IEVDGDRVRVEGLVTFAWLAPVLEAEGRALHHLGSLPHISVAGAAATGTHGSGTANGNLSSAVTALEIMDADGHRHLVHAEHPWFPAAALGL
ncbi:FAD-binding protein, partial [Acinetobacter baumannii]